MVLVDTSAWIDHLRKPDLAIESVIRAGELYTHDFVIAELALGSLPNRHQLLGDLRRFPRLAIEAVEEILAFVDAMALPATGIGFVDATLLSAAAKTQNVRIWTRDKRLAAQAERLGLNYEPA